MQKKYYKSLLGQVAYVIISGLQLLFMPNVLLQLFGFEPTSEIWIRVLGMLVLALSFYYYAMYKNGGKEVIRATVQGRLFFCAGLVMFVILGMAKPVLIGFAVVETGLALWTLSEIRGGGKE
jgi:glucose uptake protein GlcU